MRTLRPRLYLRKLLYYTLPRPQKYILHRYPQETKPTPHPGTISLPAQLQHRLPLRRVNKVPRRIPARKLLLVWITIC
ncbi:hypothetical protein AYI69_g1239 [Smittium culicis]|uniref:Uncharacterized protein n=1 Tax=Smittium culicis TaxID=133412 RepID=A0A1R1YQU1_9FUNG|nr:hypothetical protein AYI69_g1239 [Smittium culicis]